MSTPDLAELKGLMRLRLTLHQVDPMFGQGSAPVTLTFKLTAIGFCQAEA